MMTLTSRNMYETEKISNHGDGPQIAYGKTQLLWRNTQSGSMVLLRKMAAGGEAIVIKRVPKTMRTAEHELRILHQLHAAACTSGVIHALGFQEYPDRYDIFLPYYAGDLMNLLEHCQKRDALLGAAIVRDLFGQIAHTVAHVHDVHGIAHRDISPENILLSNHSGYEDILAGTTAVRPILTDWADAVYVRDGLAHGRRGKQTYLAPEVQREKVLSIGYDPCAADVWSCGALLFCMLCNHGPYNLPTYHDPWYCRLLSIGSAPSLRAAGRDDATTQWASGVLARMLQPDALHRATMREVVETV